MAAGERLICAAADLVDGGSGVRFEIGYSGRTESAFAVRFRGRVFAYYNRCAHVPIELDWNPGEFFDRSGLYLICATHGALYDPASGACRLGRCNGRGLQVVGVVERDGNIYLKQEGD